MTDKDIKALIKFGIFPDGQSFEELRETHISWVLLCQDFVYKIKKPVQLSFLDFSTLAKRFEYCQRELRLNQRLAAEIYLSVVPITCDEGIFFVDESKGEMIDYAVKMKRMDNLREMGLLLQCGAIKNSDIVKLANQIADFHLVTDVLVVKNYAQSLKEDFIDIMQVRDFVKGTLGNVGIDQLDHVISVAHDFIDTNRNLLNDRSLNGFIRDCHGDLHSGNIFILDHPVVFDCIEFNDQFRHIDILNEVAFLCMDLDFYERVDLSKLFFQAYCERANLQPDQEMQKVLLFYKFFRANVKTKVNALKLMQTSLSHGKRDRSALFRKYFALMVNYAQDLQSISIV